MMPARYHSPASAASMRAADVKQSDDDMDEDDVFVDIDGDDAASPSSSTNDTSSWFRNDKQHVGSDFRNPMMTSKQASAGDQGSPVNSRPIFSLALFASTVMEQPMAAAAMLPPPMSLLDETGHDHHHQQLHRHHNHPRQLVNTPSRPQCDRKRQHQPSLSSRSSPTSSPGAISTSGSASPVGSFADDDDTSAASRTRLMGMPSIDDVIERSAWHSQRNSDTCRLSMSMWHHRQSSSDDVIIHPSDERLPPSLALMMIQSKTAPRCSFLIEEILRPDFGVRRCASGSDNDDIVVEKHLDARGCQGRCEATVVPCIEVGQKPFLKKLYQHRQHQMQAKQLVNAAECERPISDRTATAGPTYGVSRLAMYSPVLPMASSDNSVIETKSIYHLERLAQQCNSGESKSSTSFGFEEKPTTTAVTRSFLMLPSASTVADSRLTNVAAAVSSNFSSYQNHAKRSRAEESSFRSASVTSPVSSVSISGDGVAGNSDAQMSSKIAPTVLSTSSTVALTTPSVSSAAASSGAKLPLPAWVYCTRYSDRPSSGPRSRKYSKRKQTQSSSSSGLPAIAPDVSVPTSKKSALSVSNLSLSTPPGSTSLSSSSSASSADDKRARTAFNADQLEILRREFDDDRYLTEDRRRRLADSLGLHESQIKIWFQNKRAKLKKASGVPNPLAMELAAQGLYNHSTVAKDTLNIATA